MNLDHYRGDDGHIDWDAMEAAEIAAGDKCHRCKDNISPLVGLLLGKPKIRRRRLCGSCTLMDVNRDDEVCHDYFVRCPYCGEQEDTRTWDCDLGEQMYTEGTHTIYCAHCDKEYNIQTHVSYEYTSPAMEGQEK